jgi:hypothetical protein
MRAAAGLFVVLLVVPIPAPAAPTDIARVDDYIDAPRALFGRTLADLERTLGAPSSRRPRGDGAVVAWPGLEVSLSRSGRVTGVVVHVAGHALPYGLTIGTPRARVEAVLGDAPEMSDERAFYPDADGFPNAVEFFFRDGRVRRIEWRFWAD